MSRKYLSVFALAVALAIGSTGIAVAQQETVPEAGATAADDGFDWGWIGLLGLIGLAGLAGSRRRHEPARTTTTTGTVR
jgi:MYXO-CTERM domain-containing protein